MANSSERCIERMAQKSCITCELTGAVGHDGVWGKMKWSLKRRMPHCLQLNEWLGIDYLNEGGFGGS